MQREDVMVLVQTVHEGWWFKSYSRTDNNALSSTGSHLPLARLPLESPRAPYSVPCSLHHVHELVDKSATL